MFFGWRISFLHTHKHAFLLYNEINETPNQQIFAVSFKKNFFLIEQKLLISENIKLVYDIPLDVAVTDMKITLFQSFNHREI